MEPGLLAAGWLAALLAAAVAGVEWRVRASTMELMARALHELRGPLTAARLGLHLGARGQALSEARLRAIDLELAKAALAVDDLSRIGSGERSSPQASPAAVPVAPALVDMVALARDCVEAWRGPAAAAGVELELRAEGGPKWVEGQRLRIAQAVSNLIANAIEHGGGAVEVACREAGPRVRLEVLDGGPGLPAPVDELVRRPRAGRGRRGRGLAIAAAVAVSHGGRLAAAPSQRGARLVLELPRAESDLCSA